CRYRLACSAIARCDLHQPHALETAFRRFVLCCNWNYRDHKYDDCHDDPALHISNRCPFHCFISSMVCSACQERNSEEKEKVLFFWAMPRYNASTFPDIGKTCLRLFRSGVKIQGVEGSVFA